MKLTKNQKQYLELSILIIIALICFFAWDSVIVYPIKLFVVLTHEISHGFASIITGGKISSIQIHENLGGECFTEGGIPLVIASSGYLGSFLFGVILFMSAYNHKLAIWSCTIISIILLWFAANYLVGGIGLALSILYTLILFLSPRFFNPIINSYLLKILGLISLIYVLVDIKNDLITLKLQSSDAQILSDMTGVPAFVYGLIWFCITAVALYYLVKYAFNKGFQKVV